MAPKLNKAVVIPAAPEQTFDEVWCTRMTVVIPLPGDAMTIRAGYEAVRADPEGLVSSGEGSSVRLPVVVANLPAHNVILKNFSPDEKIALLRELVFEVLADELNKEEE